MSKKPNRVQYYIAPAGRAMTGFLYPQKFNIMCPYCKMESGCSRRHLKLINYNGYWYDAIDMFIIDQNWYSQNIKGRNKKYYCCSRCLKFLIGNNNGIGTWIDNYLIADYNILTKCHLVIDNRPKTAQQAAKQVFSNVDIRVVNKNTQAVRSQGHPQPQQQESQKKKKKKSKGGGNLPQQPQQPQQTKKDKEKDKKAKWGECPICRGSVKRNGRRDKNNKRYNVIANHFSGNRQCGGSELSWDAVIVSNHKKEKYKVVIEEVTDGKL
jgi:hypothetical protein